MRRSFINWSIAEAFNVGDRVLVSGEYANDPDWLSGETAYPGTLVALIKRLTPGNLAVVELDEEIEVTVDGRTRRGRFIIFKPQIWRGDSRVFSLGSWGYLSTRRPNRGLGRLFLGMVLNKGLVLKRLK